MILNNKEKLEITKSQKRNMNGKKNMAVRIHSKMTRQEMPEIRKETHFQMSPKFEKNTKSQSRKLSDQKK